MKLQLAKDQAGRSLGGYANDLQDRLYGAVGQPAAIGIETLGASKLAKPALGAARAVGAAVGGVSALAAGAMFLPGDAIPGRMAGADEMNATERLNHMYEAKSLHETAADQRKGGVGGWFARTFEGGSAESNEARANQLEKEAGGAVGSAVQIELSATLKQLSAALDRLPAQNAAAVEKANIKLVVPVNPNADKGQ